MKKHPPSVKESNVIARARIDPKVGSVWDERIIALIAAKNTREDKIFQEHVISVAELTGGKPLSTVQFKEAEKAIKDRLVRQTYVIPQGKRGFKAYPIFEYIAVDDDGNIKAKLNSALCEHFLDLKKEFAVRSLPAFSSLTSTYAQQLFRCLNSWKGLNEVVIPLDELHNLLSTPPSCRKNFKEMRTRVLEIAHREITSPEKTAMFFDWQPVKEGLQKVVAIRFIFNPALLNVKQETPEEQAKRELAETQSEAEDCWQMYQALNKKCRPGKRSKKCQFCTSRGRMWAHNYMEQNQNKLPFGV